MDIKINLLPPEKKEELKKFRTAGVIFKIGMSALIALVVLFVFMQFCTEAIVIQKDAFAKEIERFIQTDSYVEVQKAQNEIKEKSKQAKKIRIGLKDKTDFWSVFEELNSFIPGDIYLKQVVISEGTIQIIGLAFHRESLLEFEEKLKVKKETHNRPRATTGGWKNNFTNKQNLNFLDVHAKALEELGYETYPFR